MALTTVTIAVIWSQRRPIATGAIDRMLAARGVAADYTISDIGLRMQRIENLRLGDLADPDLTADWAELSLAPFWGGVTVTAIKAHGVRLRGQLIDGRLNLGAIDQLLPATRGKAFALPDIDIQLSDTGVALRTPYGPVGIALTGRGGLRNGFRGEVQVTGRGIGTRECRSTRVDATLSIRIDARRLRADGPASAEATRCEGVAVAATAAQLSIALTKAFALADGTATLMLSQIERARLKTARATVSVDARRIGESVAGRYRLMAPSTSYGRSSIAGLEVSGTYVVGDFTEMGGTVRVARAVPDRELLLPTLGALRAASATPVGPLSLQLGRAIAGLRAGVAGSVDFALRQSPDSFRASLSRARFTGLDNLDVAFAMQESPIPITGISPPRRVMLRASGGGFPTLRAAVVEAGNGWRGTAEMAPYAGGGARLALSRAQLAFDRSGAVTLATEATIDGPIGVGRIDGLRLPVSIRRLASGDVVAAPGCTPVSYRQLSVAATQFAAGGLILCPITGGALVRSVRGRLVGGARTGPLRIAGRSGDQPLLLAATGASVDLGGRVSLSDFSALLGAGDKATYLRIARLDGSTRAGTLSGDFAGLEGKIVQVPLMGSGGEGKWRFARGRLDATGTLAITDQEDEPRFNKINADNLVLKLEGNRIGVTTTLRAPLARRAIATVDLVHDLSSADGRANFVVDGLTFGKSFRPEALTRLTTGVVADVQGRIDGGGGIRWSRDGVTSDGRFRTTGLDFSAAFGPVSGASGTIVFDDLLALSTRAGQVVKVQLVNPGVEVRDGEIVYRLRPNQIVDIERGRWPFAGGELLLDAGRLDFGQSTPRNLAFRVAELDAAKFIEQLKLENIAATGIFDGVLPIVFEASGGQVIGGRLVARTGGGTLAYVGDVSNAQTNAMTRLAFDALKAIRYDRLTIELDGALDGEIVSRVLFNGVNEAPVAPTGLARSFVGLPFKFNIAVRAPFRGLVNQARSFQDPGLLLNRPVQPSDSAKRP